MNSTWVKNILVKILKRNDIALVTPGINLNIFKPLIDIEEKYKKNKSQYTIATFVDINRDFKGTLDLFKAMELVWKELGKDKVKIKSYGFALPSSFLKYNVEYLGYVSPLKLAEIYSTADLFVSSSWYESFPLPPIESMACGCAVVTTKFGTEDYAFDGYNAYVVEPRNPHKLAEKIIMALQDIEKTKQMVKNGLKTVENFKWETQIEKYEKILFSGYPSITKDIEYTVKNLLNGTNFEIIDKMIF